MEEFRLGLEILEELVGQRHLRKLCGKIVLPASMYSLSGEAKYLARERALRKEMSDELLARLAKKTDNPRRLGRENSTGER